MLHASKRQSEQRGSVKLKTGPTLLLPALLDVSGAIPNSWIVAVSFFYVSLRFKETVLCLVNSIILSPSVASFSALTVRQCLIKVREPSDKTTKTQKS